MVESYILLRAEGDGTEESPFGPRQADLAPYTSLSWDDFSARASWTDDGTLFLNSQLAEPRVIVIRGRMSNQDALAMQSDNKVWMIASRRYDDEGEVVQTDFNQPYTAAERTLRITQLSNFTDFDYQQIANWWTADKTHREVGEKLRDYLKDINRPA